MSNFQNEDTQSKYFSGLFYTLAILFFCLITFFFTGV